MNKRVKLQSNIGLPLSELWKLYSESGAAPIIRNFCIVYIEMAFQRVDAKVSLILYISVPVCYYYYYFVATMRILILMIPV